MHRPRHLSSPSSPRGRCGCMAGCAGVWLLASACGPGVATPMPEPPTVFDLTAVGEPTGLTPAAGKEPDSKTIHVFEDRLPAHSTVRVTNLDRMDPTVAVDVPEGKAADLIVSVIDGEELRFEAITGELRSQPADAIFVLDDPLSGAFHLAPAERFACLKLEPGYRLDMNGEPAPARQPEEPPGPARVHARRRATDRGGGCCQQRAHDRLCACRLRCTRRRAVHRRDARWHDPSLPIHAASRVTRLSAPRASDGYETRWAAAGDRRRCRYLHRP